MMSCDVSLLAGIGKKLSCLAQALSLMTIPVFRLGLGGERHYQSEADSVKNNGKLSECRTLHFWFIVQQNSVPLFRQSVDCSVTHSSIHTQVYGSQNFSSMLTLLVNKLSPVDMMPIKIMQIIFLLRKFKRIVIMVE